MKPTDILIIRQTASPEAVITVPPAVQPDERMKALILPEKFNLVLYPVEDGNPREWGMQHYIELAKRLPSSVFTVFVTGNRRESQEIRSSGIFALPQIYDLSGRLSRDELISFIREADGLVSSSKEVLQLAAAMGKITIGLCPSLPSLHPLTWPSLGPTAYLLVKQGDCTDCLNDGPCRCMESIEPELVEEILLKELSSLPLRRNINPGIHQ
ncbi:MAG: hypothetical protein NTU44_16650 [Bacteroidetes bacterium]|nr:hypothetical protein [Bacteroidota bacterium]